MNLFKNKLNVSLVSQIGLFIAVFAWGSTFILVKDIVETVSPLTLITYRFLLSAILTLGVVVYIKKNPFHMIKEGCLLGLLLWLIYVPQTIGLQYTSASNSGFITGLFVVFVPIFMYFFFRQTPSLNKIISAVVALIGLWLLTGGISKINPGDAITLITAMANGMHILIADRFIKKQMDPFVLAFQQFFFVGIFSLVLCLILGQSLIVSSAGAIQGIAFLGLVPGFAAYLMQLVSQKHLPPIRVSLIFAFEPVFAALTAVVIGGEILGGHQLAGGLMILSAMVISELKFARKKS